MKLPAREIAAYARVSSEKQAQQRTIESQVTAIQERVAQDGYQLRPERWFVDDGYTGEVLRRPALEALRDQVAAAAIERLYIHSPDRLARRYAHQVLLMEEFQRAGVEVVFLNHACDESPEGELLLQIQGVIAEYERAKMLERCRRGRKQHARQGHVSVLSRAPFGYRYLKKSATEAGRFEIVPEEADILRRIFHWYVREDLPLCGITKRLNHAQIPTRTRRNQWQCSAVARVLSNPASMGRARFGRTRVGPRRSRIRAFKGQAEHPRQHFSMYRTAPEEQIEIPVPAIIDEELFHLAQERLADNRRRRRARQDGPRHLLQGLLVCQSCGRALIYQSSSAKRYSYYRCNGSQAHRFGGPRVCFNRAVRAEHLEQVVWQDVCSLLTDSERLQREHARRLQELEHSASSEHGAYEKLITRAQQSLERLLDAYQDGLVTKPEFETRSTSLRQRIAKMQEASRTAASVDAARSALRDTVQGFTEFAQAVKHSLDRNDLPTRIKILRLLIKQIEVSETTITIVYKVNPFPFERPPARGILQDCSRRQQLTT
jgi:site-specific DNA recombinase